MADLGTWVTIASLLVGGAGLLFSVITWQLSGPRLRVHALLYEEVLLLIVANGGRSRTTLRRAAIGGRRGGQGGVEVTSALSAPMDLEPGDAEQWELPWTELVPAERRQSFLHGWESVWLLLGSTRQVRAEILPVPAGTGERGVAKRPPETGWRLASRWAGLTRYEPLAMAIPLTAVLFGLLQRLGLSLAVLIAVTFLVVARSYPKDGLPRRRAVERAVVFLGVAALWAAWFWPPHLVVLVAGHFAYLGTAVVLALVGGVPWVRQRLADVGERSAILRSRVRGRKPA